jgi:hypothetical protein
MFRAARPSPNPLWPGRILGPMEKQGEQYVADVYAEGRHLRLISEVVKDGARAAVYDMDEKKEIMDELVGNLEEGRETCEERAKGLLTEPIKIGWTHREAAA